VTVQVLFGVLLVCLGILLGSAWTIQAVKPKLRRQAEERRRLNEEWSVRATRRKGDVCPYCGSPATERDWYLAPSVVEDRKDDD
jgi:hypothetical protein